jgi:heme-degrading monooxygenase HmoA
MTDAGFTGFPADAGGFPGGYTGDVAGRPVAVAVALSAADPLLAGWIEDAFGPFVLSLAPAPGFLAFRLLEAKNAGDGCLYAALTLWEDLAWFRAWQAGAGFTAAQAAARADARYAGLTAARFDFPFHRAIGGTARTLARLEGPLIARLAARFGTPAEGVAFRLALELPPLT